MEHTVVIVDDDPVAAYLLERVIKKQKISSEVTTFSGAHSALDFFDRNDHSRRQYLVFLDINMPDLSGWQLMETIQQKPYGGRMYFFIVSSSVEQADHDKVKSYPAAIGFLEKPVGPEMAAQIRAGMQLLMSRGRAGSDTLQRSGSVT